MKKLLFLFSAGATLLLAACNDSAKDTARLQATNDSLRAQIAARDSEMDSVLTIFNEIQEGFTQISQAQNRITLSRTGDPGDRQAARAQIQEDMKFIITTMRSNKERIAQLQAQVKKQGMNTAAMEKTLALLKFKCWYYETAIKDGNEDGINAMLPDKLPEEIQKLYDISHE